MPKTPRSASEGQGVLTVTGESTLCTLLSSTRISLETEEQGHHSQACPAQFLIFLGGRGGYVAILEPLQGEERSEVCNFPRKGWPQPSAQYPPVVPPLPTSQSLNSRSSFQSLCR